MSSHYNDGDPNRNDGGQYMYGHSNANVIDQVLAGVDNSDNYGTAHDKIETYRRIRGLDRYTGFPFTYVPSSSAGTQYRESSPNDGKIWRTLGRLIKVTILWPAAIAITLVAIVSGLVMSAKYFDGSTVASRAAKNEFGFYQPVPLASRFTAKELATPVTPESLLAAWSALGANKGAAPKIKPHIRAAGYAYRCMFQEGCRDSLAKLDARLGANLPMWAAVFLKPLVEKGDESAARDMCLFAVNRGTSYKDMITARELCASARALNPKTDANVKALAQLDGSWATRRAKVYSYIDRATTIFEIQGFSGLVYFLATNGLF